ncbi:MULTISPECIES: DeoR/GlpR family DNA-binding transcription regulator [unclassified Pedobacter]|uniref:DeoR/GlpR family DNA-binding transcription regulator n=1 Tax=unclassified Pedobacter TaxID=2628915 RepID=UPI0014241962|nr:MULTISPECIES: DeoR/GlpR family DNA-binding transcription regulator [unclassified Pedobacter]NII83568.1 DeoR family fructose operon transcriptional repressor [Pedobacter sp. SG908]NMN37431.1 DeoR family fructose operon transcriptional repressor [Pedobacter sp. SG918]
MTFQKRAHKILELLEELGEVDIRQLAAEINVSEVTARRDLTIMAANGLLYRTHGGAMKISELIKPVSFANKAVVNLKAKDAICKRAAEDIIDGDVIFIDCGSTAFRLCQFIKNKKIKVITNSLPVVNELQHSAVTINLIGGEVDTTRQAVHGTMAYEHITRYRASKAFLGVDGITAEGLYAGSEHEASNTLAMASQSDCVYMLCDASKIGKTSYLKFNDLSLVDILISDYNGSEIIEFQSKGISVLSVKV